MNFDFTDTLNDLARETIYELPYRKMVSMDKINVKCPACREGNSWALKSRGWVYINITEGPSYYCFNCSHACKGINVIGLLKGVDSSSAYKLLADRLRAQQPTTSKKLDFSEVSVTNRKTVLKDVDEDMDIPNHWVNISGNETVTKIVEARKILAAPYSPSNWKVYYCTRSKRIILPWTTYGKIDTYQARAIYKNQTPKYLFESGAEKSLFGKDSVSLDEKYMFFLEGALDSIFVYNSVAVGALYPTISQIAELNDDFPMTTKVWISDNYWVDEASRTKIVSLMKYGHSKDSIFKWQEGGNGKDINDIVCATGDTDYFNKEYMYANVTTIGEVYTTLLFKNLINTDKQLKRKY